MNYTYKDVRMRTVLILGILLNVFVLNGQATNLDYNWVDTISSSKFASGNSVETDSEGNIVAVGVFVDSLFTKDSIYDSYFTNYDNGFIVKYDKNGRELWNVVLETYRGISEVNSLAIDVNNDIYVTGKAHPIVDFDPSPNTVYSDAENSWGTFCFIAKYSAEGELIWVEMMEGHSKEGLDLELDKEGDLILVGNIQGECDFDFSDSTEIHGFKDELTPFIAKYTSNADLIWVKAPYKPILSKYESNVSCDSENNIWFSNYETITKFSSDGDSLFDYELKGSIDIRDIKVDNSDNVYITGDLYGQYVGFEKDQPNVKFGLYGANRPYLVKFNKDGKYLWGIAAEGKIHGNNGGGEAIAIDEEGNVCIAGTFEYTRDFDFRNEGYEINERDGSSFVAKYDSLGNFIFVEQYGSHRGACNDINIDKAGNIVLTGSYRNEFDFDPSSNNSGHVGYSYSSHFYVAKYGFTDNFITVGEITPKDKPRIKVYPNPTSTNISIDTQIKMDLNLVNSLGQKIKQVKGTTMELLNVNPGIYFLKISTQQGEKVGIQRVVVK